MINLLVKSSKNIYTKSIKKNSIINNLKKNYSRTPDKIGITKLGVVNPKLVHYNLSYDELFEHEQKNNEGLVMKAKYGDTFSIDTGKFTGRSPSDKWIVKNIGKNSDNNIWWGKVNQPINSEVFDDLYKTSIDHFNELDECYVFDGYCGANPKSQKKVAVILGTWYGGENKKGIFGLMNYWLPLEGIMSMHCSANVGENNDSALFFGLSGTGKTTLSADPKRKLIGDDEHGWDDDGIFNFEGGCYAKTIVLSEENEPEIYRAIKKDALLENVFQNDDGSPDYFNTSKTENGRVSYPIYHIDNWHEPQMASHPKNIIFLTCDAFGVLPPVSKLSNEQAMYHFLSGYTAKVAGTERGITEPQATFSACFGAAFLTLHPTRYAELLKEKLEKHNSTAFLVNTGWTA